MSKISCLENYVNKDHSHFTSFVIEPFDPGQSLTLGNAIRRTLLSELTGTGITGVRINDLKHEFALVPYLREDLVEVLANLKEIIFKESILIREKSKHIQNFLLPAYLHAKGPTIVTAGMLNLPKNALVVLNPEQYICTILDSSDFFCELDIQLGKSYQSIEDIQNLHENEELQPGDPNTLRLDVSFTPVKKVNFKVKLIHDSRGNLKESLYLEILTRGNKSPKRCLQEAFKALIDLIYPLMIDPNFLLINSELAKKFNEVGFTKQTLFKPDDDLKKEEEKERKKKEQKNEIIKNRISEFFDSYLEKTSSKPKISTETELKKKGSEIRKEKKIETESKKRKNKKSKDTDQIT